MVRIVVVALAVKRIYNGNYEDVYVTILWLVMISYGQEMFTQCR